MYVLLRCGGEGENFGNAHKEYMVETESDVGDIPTEGLAPGSIARKAACKEMWEYDLSGQWVKF